MFGPPKAGLGPRQGPFAPPWFVNNASVGPGLFVVGLAGMLP